MHLRLSERAECRLSVGGPTRTEIAPRRYPTTNSAILSYSTVIVTMKFTENCVYDKSRSAEEPDDGKLSRPVRYGRVGRRLAFQP